MYEGRNYIDGEWQEIGKDTFEDICPIHLGCLGHFPQSSPEEINIAYLAARKSFPTWKALSRVKRAELFYRLSGLIEERLPQIATVISFETGKNYNESVAEVNEALHMAQYAFGSGRMPFGEMVASEIPEKDSYMLRKPKGVVAIISPWNFPFAIGAFWCAAPALVEGNTVVLKPSEDAPFTSQLAMALYEEAGFPPGVINLIHGDGSVGDILIREDVDHICFTGSAEVGQHIRKACAESWHKTCSCEMGSKSAVIVFDDANYNLAIESCVASAFKLSGQRCVSSGRILVQRSLCDKFAEDFVKVVEKTVSTESPFMDSEDGEYQFDINPNCYMGPIINQQQFDRVLKYNQMVREDQEATLLLDSWHKKPGYFISPMIYKTEWRDVPYLKNEVFGPHVAIIPFDNISDAISIYNDTDYGLAVGVITEDFKKARICRDSCDYGMCYWNGGSIAAESHLAFGGIKKSGNGYPSAARTFRAVTHEVSWTVNHGESLQFPQGME